MQKRCFPADWRHEWHPAGTKTPKIAKGTIWAGLPVKNDRLNGVCVRACVNCSKPMH